MTVDSNPTELSWNQKITVDSVLCLIIGASLSEPHIDHDSPRMRNHGIYLSFTPHLSHPGSQGPCMPWNALCIPVYLRAHVRDLQLHALNWLNSKDDWNYSCLQSAMKIIDEDRLVNAQTHGINRAFSLLRQWNSICQATCQRPCVNQNNRWAAGLSWRSYQHKCDTELLQCLRVICGCRAVQTNSAETSLVLLAM